MKILDCTMRDGGYVNNWNFTKEQARECYAAARDSGLSYCEIGFRRTPAESSFGPWYYTSEDLVNETFNPSDKCKLAVMAQVGTFTIDDFVPKSQSKISMIRLLIAYHCKNKDDEILDTEIISETVSIARKLMDMGYEVCINVGRIDKMSEEQMKTMCTMIQDVPISYFYIADTYGNLGIYKTRKILATLKQYYPGKIGFHAHDNLQNASIKSIDALYNGADIVDVTFGGYGRGSGNAKAELVLAHLIMSDQKDVLLFPAIEYANKWVERYTTSGVVYLLTGMWSMHVNYAIEIIEKHGNLSMQSVYHTLEQIVKENKHNFYDANLISKILKI